MAWGEQPDDDDDDDEDDDDDDDDCDDSGARTREEELRSGCEELQEELQSLGEGDDMEEKSSATLWREPERDWGREGGGTTEEKFLIIFQF